MRCGVVWCGWCGVGVCAACAWLCVSGVGVGCLVVLVCVFWCVGVRVAGVWSSSAAGAGGRGRVSMGVVARGGAGVACGPEAGASFEGEQRGSGRHVSTGRSAGDAAAAVGWRRAAGARGAAPAGAAVRPGGGGAPTAAGVPPRGGLGPGPRASSTRQAAAICRVTWGRPTRCSRASAA